MTDDVFERRTRRFEEILGILGRLAETPWARFSTDPEKYASTERFLQLAVEVLDDLGAHVVARARVGPVASYRDVPTRLLEAGHLSEAQALTWRRIIGFRNVLVHDYLEVDLTIVYDVLQNRLDDLRDLHRTLLAAHRRLG
jgi:uncharacterized protein YutE (UPF0331/DUF86 family)